MIILTVWTILKVHLEANRLESINFHVIYST